jgi:hypothetical protein
MSQPSQDHSQMKFPPYLVTVLTSDGRAWAISGVTLEETSRYALTIMGEDGDKLATDVVVLRLVDGSVYHLVKRYHRDDD